MTGKPTTAAGYGAELASDARRMCLYVATIFGDLIEDVIVVGALRGSFKSPDSRRRVAQVGLFRVIRNAMLLETGILTSCMERLRGLLPAGWRADREDASGTDALVRLTAPDKSSGRFVVEVKRRLPPGGVGQLSTKSRRFPDDRPAVFAGWLSPSTRRALRDADIGFLDLTGNVELHLPRPGLFLRDVGAAKDPSPASGAIKSLRGNGAGRAIRALVDFSPPYGIRELAQLSGASAPVISRVAQLLERDELLARNGQVTRVDWEGALRRWAEDYDFAKTNRVLSAIDPRGLKVFVAKLAEYTKEWAATGTFGVPTGVAVVPLGLAAVYVRSAESAAQELKLTLTETGANVLLVEPPDDGAFVRSRKGVDAVVRCAPSQVVVDLLTGPGRGSSEAEALLLWMRRNTGWRTQV
jgi:hypothetical protein